tara:strand:+ start:643 stop:1143 length:501 start_codon:yes stop_codon:yes gene_type:complete
MSVNENKGSQAYISLLTDLFLAIKPNKLVNTITQGDITEVDLAKSTMFPLVHMIIGNASFQSQVIDFDVTIMLMDIVHNDDIVASSAINELYAGDNEIYVLNSMLNVGNHIMDSFSSGVNRDGNNYINISEVNAEPFRERFENNLAGWSFNFSVTTRNNIDRCNTP